MKLYFVFVITLFLGLNTVCNGAGEHKHDTKEAHEHLPMKEENQINKNVGICPVMGGEASTEYSYTYKNKIYFFCCSDCIEKFSSDPARYISKIKDIKLIAYKYGFTPDPIVVKKDDIVRFTITSKDVTHGVYIKQYGIKVKVKKGEIKKVEFLADKSGKFDILCSIYCGSGHSKMKGIFIVEENEEEKQEEHKHEHE
ncbi:MAG: hypothetical protein A2539_07045 [Elusimicrobia bacterium RIFOXYD2_FULL_34_15]|nr:MAG: hypothetical protein A2539_07045 [Elusimicrobia bacterium RIFOXYD2_FULL_34_15]